MNIVWNEQSFRWFKNASDYTGYNQKLAEILKEYIKPGGTLCDVGCGAGHIDFALAGHCSKISCVDISQDAVDAVAETARDKQLENITAICMDGAKLTGSWDTVMALFHGGDDCFEKYFPLATDCLILAVHASRLGDFGPEGRKVRKCSDTGQFERMFQERGIRYTLRNLSLEYGQPFTDRTDAADFVRAYTLPMEDMEMEDYLSKSLVETGRADFPYYLPKKKKFGLFVIRRKENEKKSKFYHVPF